MESGNQVEMTSANLYEPLTLYTRPIFSHNEVAFSGIGLDLDTENPFVFPILSAEEHSYSTNTQEITEKAGPQLGLVAGYQSQNNHRAVITGSLQMCSDETMSQNKGNEQFCRELVDWAMQESGVLRTSPIRHNKVGETSDENPENYPLESHVDFNISIE